MAGIMNHRGNKLIINIFNCTACQIDPTRPGLFRPGDSLEGRIFLSSRSSFDVKSAEIRLQGIQHASVLITPQQLNGVQLRAGSNFLDVPYHLVTSLESSGSNCTFTSPFQFILPDTVANASEALPLSCHQLPPSFNVSNAFSKGWTPCPPPKAFITYVLHCVVRLDTTHGVETIEAYKEIKFLPNTEIQPPTFVSSFPGEFSLDVERPVRNRIFGRQLGKLRVITEEPNPIVYASGPTAPSTHCFVRIDFSGPSLSIPAARKMTFRVKLALRSKTYYSMKDIPCIPKQAFLTSNGCLRLHNDITKVSEFGFSELKWTQLPPQESRREENYQNKPVIKLDISPIPSNPSKRIPKKGLEVGQGNEMETWTTSISFPVAPEQMLQPTFCTKFIARSYSLLFRIHIIGAQVEMVDCEVPLQVVYPPTNRSESHASVPQAPHLCLGRAALWTQDAELPNYGDT